jgi:hypothetical protein
MEHDPETPSLNPNALTPADAARLLSKAGGQPVRVETIWTVTVFPWGVQ